MWYQQVWYLYFLVITVFVYWALCRSILSKKWFLVVASVALLASLQLAFTLALLGWTVTVFFASRYLLTKASSKRLRVLVVVMLALLGYLSFFKYLPGILALVFSSDSENGSINWLQSNVVIPIGLSYFTFKFLHYLINAYRRTLVEHSALDFTIVLLSNGRASSWSLR